MDICWVARVTETKNWSWNDELTFSETTHSNTSDRFVCIACNNFVFYCYYYDYLVVSRRLFFNATVYTIPSFTLQGRSKKMKRAFLAELSRYLRMKSINCTSNFETVWWTDDNRLVGFSRIKEPVKVQYNDFSNEKLIIYWCIF